MTRIDAVTNEGDPDEGGRQVFPEVGAFIDFARSALEEEFADMRISDRLTESAICLRIGAWPAGGVWL